MGTITLPKLTDLPEMNIAEPIKEEIKEEVKEDITTDPNSIEEILNSIHSRLLNVEAALMRIRGAI